MRVKLCIGKDIVDGPKRRTSEKSLNYMYMNHLVED